MLHVSLFEITQIMTVTITFILHLLIFYDLSYQWETNMMMVETTVYGTYFVMKLGFLVAVLTDGTFTHPLEVMTRMYGAVFYNVLGLIVLIAYVDKLLSHHTTEFSAVTVRPIIFGLGKGIFGLLTSALYYIEVFQT